MNVIDLLIEDLIGHDRKAAKASLPHRSFVQTRLQRKLRFHFFGQVRSDPSPSVPFDPLHEI